MDSVILSTSTSCISYVDIPNSVEIMPTRLMVNGVDFIDSVNMTPDIVSDFLTSNNNSDIESAAPTEQMVIDKFNELYEKGIRSVFAITISAQLSDCYRVINEVAQQFADRMDIYVYDSKTVNINEGFLALEADYLLTQDYSFTHIITHLDRYRRSDTQLLTISQLDRLIKAKKMSAPAGFVANLFQIKPVIEVTQSGTLTGKHKVRKTSQALMRLAEYANEMQRSSSHYSYIIDAGDEALTDEFIHVLKHSFNIRNLPVYPMSPVAVSRTGINTVGIGGFVDNVPSVIRSFTDN